jgi:hypothetical protein
MEGLSSTVLPREVVAWADAQPRPWAFALSNAGAWRGARWTEVPMMNFRTGLRTLAASAAIATLTLAAPAAEARHLVGRHHATVAFVTERRQLAVAVPAPQRVRADADRARGFTERKVRFHAGNIAQARPRRQHVEQPPSPPEEMPS